MAVVISQVCDGCEKTEVVTRNAHRPGPTIDAIPDGWVSVEVTGGRGVMLDGLPRVILSFHSLECMGRWAYART